jgi:hypothetical protein
MMGTNTFSSNTTIAGNFTVQNNNGIEIFSNGNKLRLVVNENDASFENDNYPNQNIVLSKGLRTSITENEVIFHKPGDTITDKSSPNQVKLPFNTDLTNYNKPIFFSL